MGIEVRKITEADRDWVLQSVREAWGSTTLVSRGSVYQTEDLDAFVAVDFGERVGLLVHRCDATGLEVIVLQSFVERRGVGSKLLERAVEQARQDHRPTSFASRSR